jgi:hypothetical protein
VKILYEDVPWTIVQPIRRDTTDPSAPIYTFGPMHVEPRIQSASNECLLQAIRFLNPTYTELEELHNGSNGLRVVMCTYKESKQRGPGNPCEERIMVVVHYATWILGHRHYARYIVTFATTDDHRILSVGKPFLFPTMDITFAIYITTLNFLPISTRNADDARSSLWKGYLDSNVIIGFGLIDKGGAEILPVRDLLSEHWVCQ